MGVLGLCGVRLEEEGLLFSTLLTSVDTAYASRACASVTASSSRARSGISDRGIKPVADGTVADHHRHSIMNVSRRIGCLGGITERFDHAESSLDLCADPPDSDASHHEPAAVARWMKNGCCWLAAATRRWLAAQPRTTIEPVGRQDAAPAPTRA